MGTDHAFRVTPLAEQGCPVCRARWLGHDQGQPRLIGDNVELWTKVYLCDICGSYWEEGTSYPHVVSFAEAQSVLPELKNEDE
ncbi:MAG: hypothetical protein JWP75_1652 [Frondihabitans sp.]|nr:hypothetical protein [Frondihabitans sp.]